MFTWIARSFGSSWELVARHSKQLAGADPANFAEYLPRRQPAAGLVRSLTLALLEITATALLIR